MHLKSIKNYSLIAFLLFYQLNVLSQDNETVTINGKVSNGQLYLENIYIHNKTNNHLTVSDSRGVFSIPVKLNDTLIFSGIEFKKEEVTITKSIIDSRYIFIKLEEFIYELDEVVIEKKMTGSLSIDIKKVKTNLSEVSAQSLNLPNSDLPKKTPFELKIYSLEANKGNVYNFIDYVSGRTKKNKKIIKILTKENELNKVFSSYPKFIYSDILNIPDNKVNSFISFCENDENFWKSVSSNDKIMILDYIIKKSKEFKNKTEKNSITQKTNKNKLQE